MTEASAQELSLRDVLEILKRHRIWLWTLPLLFGVAALIYGFFIAEPTYASTATVSVAPLEVQVQLEQRIQVQGQDLLTFQGLEAIALSEEVVRPVWEALRKEGRLPTRWQDQGDIPGLERMLRDFSVKDESPRLTQPFPQGRVPPVVASLRVEAPSPEVAAKVANLWAEGVVRQVNEIPLARLKASLVALEEQLAPAERAYREAEARMEAFNRTTTLPQDQVELSAKTQERVGLDQELAALERDLAAIRGRIPALEGEIAQQRAVVASGLSLDQLALIDRRLEEARRNLQAETERARQAFNQAAQALEAFKRRERIAEWRGELGAVQGRLAEIPVRQARLETELASRRATLGALEADLAKEPKSLELYKEVVADPVVAQAVAGQGLEALKGLALRVQEINPVYPPLLTQAIQLRAEVRALEAEKASLEQERARLEGRAEELRKLLPAQEREKEALTLEYATKKAAYEAFRARYDQIANLAAQDLTFDSPNPEYHRLRSALIDAQEEEARLSARKAALEARLRQVEARLEVLKARVARAEVEERQLKQALELSKNAYLALAQKKTDLQIEIASSQSTLAQVLAPAYPVYEKVAPKRALIFAAALFLGLMLGVMAAFVAEALRPKEAQAAYLLRD